MKKSTLFAAALLLAGASFTASAQDDMPAIYVSGAFNDYAPEENPEWALTFDAEGAEAGMQIYRGTFEVPAGECSFNFLTGFGTLVPVVNDEPSASSVNIAWDDDFYAGIFSPSGASRSYWEDANWTGGKLEIILDFDSYEIMLSKVTEGDVPALGQVLYIAGEFNGYAPEEQEIWSLTAIDETSFRGTFNIPATEFSFYLDFNGMALVPGVEEDGEYVANATSVEVLNGDNGFDGYFATTGTPRVYWVNEAWTGGDVEVTVDLNEYTINISKVENDEPFEGANIFVAGAWNEYAPEGQEIWQLNVTEDENTYRGTFNIPAEKFSLHLVGDMFEIVPAQVNAEGELEPATQAVPVEFGEPMGIATTGIANPAANWTVADWTEDNDVEITIDLANNEIIFSLVEEEPGVDSPLMFVAGNFNEYDPANQEVWSLTTVEGDPNIYRGTFDVPAGELSFYIDFRRMYLVPGMVNAEGEVEPTEESVDVLVNAVSYEGKIATSPVANTYWQNRNWNGGLVEITVDLENEDIIIATVEDEPTAPANLFVAGAWNEYAPEGLETWQLNVLDDLTSYRGVFEVPAEQFSLHFVSDMFELVPAVENEEGELEAVTAPVNVEFGEEYSFTTTGIANPNANWTVENWEGGNVEMTVDFVNHTVIFSVEEEQPETGINLYVAGLFNEYAPEGLEIWQLGAIEGDANTYRGTFEVPAGEFSLHFVSDMFELVPAVENAEGELEAVTAPVNVVDGEQYAFTTTGIANPEANWQVENWEGGYVEMTVDIENNIVIFSLGVEPPFEGINLFVSGEFNEYAPEGLEIWQLGALEDNTEIYRGTFEIPEGQFSLRFVSDMFELVPAVENAEGELEAATAPVNVEDGEQYAFTTTGVANPASVWTVENWEGGNVEMTVDFENNTVVFSFVSEEPEAGINLFVSGAFNEYAPEGLEIWQLGALEDNTEIYRGTFEIPEGQFSLRFVSDMFELVPAVENEEGELEAATAPVNVEDGEQYAFTTTGVANPASVWTVENWEGGYVEMTVDFENNIVIFSLGVEPPFEGVNLFVSGAFNEFAPEGLEIWQLSPVEDDTNTYRGTFEIPADQFSLRFVSDMFELVPAVENAEGELEAATAPVNVEDGEVYSFTTTGVANPASVWTVENWEGGYVEMTVDFANNLVIFSLDVDAPVADVWYVRGPFNEFMPFGNEAYALVPVADENGVYTGVIEIPAGEFDINFLSPAQTIFVPAAIDNEVITFTDNTYVGGLDMAYDEFEESFTWSDPTWEGGNVTITIDANEGTLTIVKGGSMNGINGINADDANTVIYNLNGVRVDGNKLTKGIYIVNGKKVVL